MTVVEHNDSPLDESPPDELPPAQDLPLCIYKYYPYTIRRPCLGPDVCEGFEMVSELKPEDIDFVVKYYPKQEAELMCSVRKIPCAIKKEEQSRDKKTASF